METEYIFQPFFSTPNTTNNGLRYNITENSIILGVDIVTQQTKERDILIVKIDNVIAFRQTPDVSNNPQYEGVIGCLQTVKNSSWVNEINNLLSKQNKPSLPADVKHYIQYFAPDDFIEILASEATIIDSYKESLKRSNG
jgi:hypothetical protein